MNGKERGFCCHFCNGIQWVKKPQEYKGTISNVFVEGKGNIRFIACNQCISKEINFIETHLERGKWKKVVLNE